MSKMEGCMICGKELVYRQGSNINSCYFCKTQTKTNVECPDHHFVCDHCHSAPAIDSITRISETTTETDPVKIGEIMMKLPSVPMHGPEHHVINSVAVLTALRNIGKIKHEQVLEGIRRAKMVPGGSCGNWGACGAALGAGIAHSVFTQTTPLSAGLPWKQGMNYTAHMLTKVGETGGPRCCKRGTRTALIESRKLLNLPGALIPVCDFIRRNKQCIGIKCPYFPK